MVATVFLGDKAGIAHNGGFTVKGIQKREEAFFLVPENSDMEPLRIDPESDFQVWGIVTYVIHPVR